MVTGGEDPQPLLRFYERLSRNPSWRSTQQLFDFLAHENLPIEPSGHFLAYKAVRRDYTDIYSGSVSNAIGQRPTMPRNQISDDADLACHVGFHVGALKYAQDFISSGQAGIEGARRTCLEAGASWSAASIPSTSYASRKTQPMPRCGFVSTLSSAISAKLCPLPPCPRRRASLRRRARRNGRRYIKASPMPPSRSSWRCPDELAKYLRRHMHVVGPLPASRMGAFVPGDGRGPMRRDIAQHPVIRLALRPHDPRRPLLVGEMNPLGGQDAFALFPVPRSRSGAGSRRFWA